MPRCYLVKKGSSQRHEAAPPRSPTEASVAPPCYSPELAEPQAAEYAELDGAGGGAGAGKDAVCAGAAEFAGGVGAVGVAERSAADTEAAHELLSLAQSLPPLPPAATVVTVLDPAPLLPVYTYTIQPTNIYILAEEPTEPVYHSVAPIQAVDYDQLNYVYTTTDQEPVIEVIDQSSYIEAEQGYVEEEPPQITIQELDGEPEIVQELELEFEAEVEAERSPEPESVTNPKDKTAKYDCKECGKRYATSSNLSRHKQTHRSLDSQAAKRCGECGKAYVSMPALAMHVLTHRMGHVCGVCGKQFSRPWLLRGHLRSHTGEKPYSCAACGKAFADRSNLRAHLQTHSSDKKHECPRCHKTFALKSYLNKHVESTCVHDSDDGIYGDDDDDD